MLDTIHELLDSSRDELLRLQTDLVAIPALGPTNSGQGEQAKAGYLAVLTLDRTTSHDSRSGILTFGRMAVKDGKSTAWFLRKLLLHSLGTWPHGGPRA